VTAFSAYLVTLSSNSAPLIVDRPQEQRTVMNLARAPKVHLALMASVVLLMAAAGPGPQAPSSEFSSSTIDLGVVVRDVQKSVDFYTDLIGFTEVPGFAVDEEFCRGAGLTDGHGLEVRVLVLKQDKTATSLKLMSLSGVESKASDNAFVHSQLGYSYITIRTVSLKPALERLKEAALADENVFAALLEAVQHSSLGQITQALYEVGGEYRRNL